ncbi:unnamed protein product [Clonostachys rosea f. rosea IK726]|uniref:Uncharacterized protein n=1 Tax=Clonostachys rosea f. rosea IK726 TaxID=1349383 RepID=A0ACA9T6E6_BIOOC|nr:unnamed protein product [Clonostachys rosea f. rosea IK726]
MGSLNADEYKDDAGYLRKSSETPEHQRWSMKNLISKIKKKNDTDLEDFMVIGIDFGTTYSGAAWATVADFESEEINLITNWPGIGGEEGKAPTELFYEHGDVMWGYGIPADADPVRWFKLLLLQEEDLAPELRQSDFVLRARKMLRENNKTATDLIADYLKALWAHILNSIKKARSKTVIEALRFHVVITVPAIWKDYARTAMEEAAKKAGILDDRPAGSTTLAFAPEPEAAALATLCEKGRVAKKDDVFVICDAGGGTVDLISYRVGGLEPIELHEAVLGSGGLCGGIFIDEAFESICKARLGRQWSNLSQTGVKELMKDQWEYGIKPQFTPEDKNKEYIVAIPAEAFKNGADQNDLERKPVIKNGRIHFTSEDIEKAFAAVFADIVKLIDGQISKAKEDNMSVKGIILVGGLGSSPYLYEYLSEKYGGNDIDVLQSAGIRPRTAICRGAIFKGFLDAPSGKLSNAMTSAGKPLQMPVRVVSTIARQSLGVEFTPLFEEGVHPAEDKYWDKDEGVWRAGKQMLWYLKKGENVSKKEPVKNTFYRTFAKAEDFKDTVTETVQQCEDDVPPTRLGPSIKELCKIHCRLDDIPFESLDDYKGENNQDLKRYMYDIEMVPSGASNIFAVYHQGTKMGSHDASVEYTKH